MDRERLEKALGECGVRLRKGMAQLVAKAVERKPPFDRIELESCFEPYRTYLLAHPEQKEEMTTAFAKSMAVVVAGDLVREQPWIEKWLAFEKAYEAECGRAPYIPPPTLKVSTLKKKDVAEVLGRVMKDVGYVPDKGPSRTVVRLSKKSACAGKFFLDFELGTFGIARFSVYLGTQDPDYSVELENFLCIKRRSRFFSNREECESAAYEAHELLTLALPFFEESVCEILSAYQYRRLG